MSAPVAPKRLSIRLRETEPAVLSSPDMAPPLMEVPTITVIPWVAAGIVSTA
jgi:hypothetical protein